MSLARARELRSLATPAERRLWTILHSFRAQGFHFRRQVEIGPYYADVACLHARLVIEIDGSTHSTDEEIAHDRKRDSYLRSRVFRIVRVSNSDVLYNPDGVHRIVADSLNDVVPMAPTPSPSPQGGGVPRKRKLRTALRELAERNGEAPPSHPSPLRGGAGGGGSHHKTSEET